MRALEKQYMVNYYDVDFKGTLKLTSLMNFFGDIATEHAEKLGIGKSYVEEEGYAWVLYKWDVELIKDVEYEEVITIKTIPEAFNKFFGYRSFLVKNKLGEVIAKANSIWIMMDIHKRKAVRIPKKVHEMFVEESNNSEDFKYLHNDIDNKIDEAKLVRALDVCYSELDTNGHVNNMNYIKWALDSIAFEEIKEIDIKKVEVMYKRECTINNKVKVFEFKNDENKTKCYTLKDEADELVSVVSFGY